MLRNWCFQIVMLEKTLESPLDHREIKPVNPKRNQPWIFTRRTDAKAEAPILWPPNAKNTFIGKDPDAGKDWRQEEKDWLVWSPCNLRGYQESFPASQFESINFLAFSLLYGPTLTSVHDYWENHSFAIHTFVSKVMSLLWNTLSRFVISFLPRNKSFKISFQFLSKY